jgi:SAM-dependent methyltransferase
MVWRSTIMEPSPTVADVERFWDNRPCNIKHSDLPIGSEAYFDQVETRRYLVENHIPRFADFGAWKGCRVLEIGCGIGSDTIRFARAGADVTAIDISQKSIDIAQERAYVYRLADKIKFIHGDAERLHLSLGLYCKPFDLVYAFGVLHHTPNPKLALWNIYSYTHKDSTLKLMLYNKYSYKALAILAKNGFQIWKFNQLMAKYSEAQSGCPITRVYSKADVRELMAGYRHMPTLNRDLFAGFRKAYSGFKIVDIKTDFIFPYKVSDYVNYKYNKTTLFKYMPESLFNFLKNRFGWHLLITAKPE